LALEQTLADMQALQWRRMEVQSDVDEILSELQVNQNQIDAGIKALETLIVRRFEEMHQADEEAKAAKTALAEIPDDLPDPTELEQQLAEAGAQRNARFSALYEQYLGLWALHGSNGFLCHFTAGASDWAQQYGNWGLTESMRAATSTKLAGFDAARAAPRPANALGLALPAARHEAASFAGTYHESPYPPFGALAGPKYNASWLYPLAAAAGDLADGRHLRVVVYTALAAAPTGQQVEACVQGAGALRCASLDVAQGGDVAGGLSSGRSGHSWW
jgi:hypothetical protein